ncbi:siroheme decarboxylase [Bathymodiolus platifrons methanotrophic gill symbiont]|uniref:Lrp/AsnC family transcriptional regulator n=1 Tax=Bathymodiolus platifrons methanotrophic gill symbiont TaxID=113268 RepID=UPI001B63E49E|nr:Lrp/AsnC family transcriptional regulator [Bathymodiolus platifrons methanotrophic gill symbiont]GFO75579.1 siroheme decarboxylase [Bathymodiolus platifrons methanotrophic gill symbiont]
MLSILHKQLLNNFQQEFPLSPRPFQDIANILGVSEDEVLSAYRELDKLQFISRIGPVIQPNYIGLSTLIAMQVPGEQLSAVASIVNHFPEVNHDYEREHLFNLWFVLIADDEHHLQTVITGIEGKTGIKTMQLPLLEDYFINLGFQLDLEDNHQSESVCT